MGYVKQRGDGWRAFVQRGAYRPTKTFDTKREALDWIVAEEAACLAGERGAGSGAQTLADAIDRYLASADLGRSERTRLAVFKREPFAAQPLSTLTPETFSTWRDARRAEVKDATVIREMTIWRGVLEYARTDLDWVKVNPIKGVKRPPEPPPRDRLITAEEIAATLDALDWREDRIERLRHEVACAFLIALETAMRCGEILALRPEDVAGKVAHVRKSTTDPENLRRSKNGDPRSVPLSSRARELFAMLRKKQLHGVRKISDGRLFHVDEASLDTTFRRARTLAGLSGFTFHDSRANALTQLAKRLEILDLARMVGHRDPRSLMIYYREPAASIAERLG